MIYKHCPNCKRSNALKAVKCSNCGETLGSKYRIIVKEKGNRTSRVVDSLIMAREIEATIKTDMLRDEYAITNHRTKKIVTLNDIWDKYLPMIQTSKKSWACDLSIYNLHLEPVFGDKPLNEISPFLIEKFKRSFTDKTSCRGKSFSQATIKHAMVILSRLFVMAIRWNKFKDANPVSKVKMPKLDNELVRFLDAGQLAKLEHVLDIWPVKQSRDIIRFLLYTGCRRGEALSLTWADVDLDRALITLQAPKGGRSVTLPVNDLALDVLKGIEKTESPFLFHRKNGDKLDVAPQWKAIKKQAGIPTEFRLHDLRHHYASSLVSNGVDIYTVSKLLSHKSLEMTKRYAHLSDAAMKSATDKASQIFSRQSAEIIQLKSKEK